MENLPKWLEYTILLLGSGGIVWTVWNNFGEAIQSFFTIKTDIKTGQLDNESQEIDVIAKYKTFIDGEMNDLMQKYVKLKKQVETDHKKLTEQIEEDRRIMKRQRSYIVYSMGLLKANNIKYKEYTDGF